MTQSRQFPQILPLSVASLIQESVLAFAWVHEQPPKTFGFGFLFFEPRGRPQPHAGLAEASDVSLVGRMSLKSVKRCRCTVIHGDGHSLPRSQQCVKQVFN